MYCAQTLRVSIIKLLFEQDAPNLSLAFLPCSNGSVELLSVRLLGVIHNLIGSEKRNTFFSNRGNGESTTTSISYLSSTGSSLVSKSNILLLLLLLLLRSRSASDNNRLALTNNPRLHVVFPLPCNCWPVHQWVRRLIEIRIQIWIHGAWLRTIRRGSGLPVRTMMRTMNTLWPLWNCQIVSSNFLAFSTDWDLFKFGRKVVLGYTINFVVVIIISPRLHKLIIWLESKKDLPVSFRSRFRQTRFLLRRNHSWLTSFEASPRGKFLYPPREQLSEEFTQPLTPTWMSLPPHWLVYRYEKLKKRIVFTTYWDESGEHLICLKQLFSWSGRTPLSETDLALNQNHVNISFWVFLSLPRLMIFKRGR